jgi:hypothetical protein
MALFTYPGAGELVAYDHDNLSVGVAASGLTSAKLTVSDGQTPPRARRCKSVFITVETNSIRIRWDGGDPVSAGVGHLLAGGDSIEINGETTVRKVRMIRESADATVRVTYSRTA